MNCSVCNLNPAVAKCSVCGHVICKNCGALCPTCKKPVCRSHLFYMPTGQIVCRNCAPSKQSQPSVKINVSPSPPKPEPKKQEENVSLSFEDLSAELGDVSIKVKDKVEPESTGEKMGAKEPIIKNPLDDEHVENPFNLSAETQEPAGTTPTSGYKHLKRKPSDDPNEFRILTASSPKPTPMWVSGLISAILAFILSLPLTKNTGTAFFPPLFSYSIILLAGGSIVWNGYGLLLSEDSTFNKRMCIPGIIFAIIAIIIAIIGLK
ncbi:MAG: hypothetical protein LDL53_10435 [Candidatus Hydrogenedens sp.]|nr:hypothetical protein [Candidatus Hydrogenedens sp.]